MELHSYAKRRTAKKWTLEQKRKLVEARICHDGIFTNEPRNSVQPWKKILTLAKLDDYNVFFVRKQWSNMVAKYKQYKQNRLGNIPFKAIDGEMIQKITHEWEFFQPIHHYMTRKTTNLHSYALMRRSSEQQDAGTKVEQQQQENRVNVFSSDTNEDFARAPSAVKGDSFEGGVYQQVETDQEFYWQHALDNNGAVESNGGYAIACSATESAAGGGGGGGGGNPAHSYFADASEDTQESMVIEPILLWHVKSDSETEQNGGNGVVGSVVIAGHHELPPHSSDDTPTTSSSCLSSSIGKEEFVPTQKSQQPQAGQQQRDLKTKCVQAENAAAATGAATNTTTTQAHKRIGANATPRKDVAHLSERAKYYRHKRRFNRRLERRFDALLHVFGQIVRAEYPSIDVSPVLGAAAATGAVINTLFSSGEENEEDEDENEDDDGIAEVDNAKNVAVNDSAYAAAVSPSATTVAVSAACAETPPAVPTPTPTRPHQNGH